MCGTSVCRRHIGCRCTDIWTHNHNDINAFANLAQCPACTDPTSTHAVRPTTCKLLREHFRFRLPSSGAGTNLKVWGGASIRRGEKNFWSVVSLHFLALKVQLVVVVSAFVMVSTAWSVSCLLFFYSRCPPCPAIL